MSAVYASGNVEANPELNFLPIRFYFLFMPALFLYAESLTRKLNWQKEYRHLVPGILEFIIALGLFLLIKTSPEIYWNHRPTFEIIDSIYIFIAWFWITGYAVATVLFVRKHQKAVENYYSNTQGKLLGWVKAVAIYVIIFNVVMLVTSLLISDEINEILTPFINGFKVLFIFWVALSGFRQTSIEMPKFEDHLLQKDQKISESKSLKNISASANTGTENDNQNEESNRLFEKIKLKIETEKFYTDTHLHLNDLAQNLHIAPRQLSGLINEKAGVNFNQFINQFRVEEVKRILVNPKFSHYNMLGIAEEVGFNSKATFYAKFKELAGTTPNKFQKMQLLKA